MTTNLRQLMREMTEGYRFKKRMCRTPRLLSDCKNELHGRCHRLSFSFTSSESFVCECWCHSASLPCPNCGWKQLAGFTQCINCNAQFARPVKVPSKKSDDPNVWYEDSLNCEAINHPIVRIEQ